MRLPRVPRFVAADLVFFHDPAARPRPAWWRAASAVGVTLVSLAPFAISDALAPPRALSWSDKHRNGSLEIAFNRAFCGTGSKLSPSFPIARHLEAHPERLDIPLVDVAGELAGSAAAYCSTVVQPFLNNENSLMLEMALILKARPRLSLRGLGWWLQASRIVALLLLAYVLLENGASLSFAGIVLSLSLGILAYLGSTSYYSVYPFLAVLLALAVACLSLSLQRRLPLSGLGHPASTFFAGWLTGFAVNMRSSHLPVYLTLLALYFLAGARLVRSSRPGWPSRRRLGWLGIGVLSAVVGYALFTVWFIRPLSQDTASGQSHPHHPVAHALVLGLAVPENDLSRREGIAWEDSVGLTLARRVDPQVVYLRQGYESALFRYYFRLWAEHPREMLGIYVAKLRVAGHSMISKLLASPIGPLAWPLAWVPNGASFLVLYAALFALSVFVHVRFEFPLAFTLALLTAAGLLLQLESALVYPVFDMTHHATQLFCFLVLAALAWQLPFEGASRALRSAWQRRRAARAQA
jgi:hypothetical protein